MIGTDVFQLLTISVNAQSMKENVSYTFKSKYFYTGVTSNNQIIKHSFKREVRKLKKA